MAIQIFTSHVLLSTILLILLAMKLNIPKKLGLYSGIVIGFATFPIVLLIARWFPSVNRPCFLPIEAAICLFFTGIVIAVRFFRDPERKTPDEKNIIISPADGTVRYIYQLNDQEIPVSEKKGNAYSILELSKTDMLTEGSYLIGIEMSVMDNHVNRSPIEGEIILQQPSKGEFLSLRSIESIFQNERVTTVIRNNDLTIGVVQIASRLVRRIVSYHPVGKYVKQGERIGMIRFGSQVDVIIPKKINVELFVKQGQHVTAGETVLAKWTHGGRNH